MRRGQTRKPDPPRGADGLAEPTFSKRELLEACDLSAKTFDSIRKAARISGPGHGGLDWAFSLADVAALIHRAESGQWSDRGRPAATAWRRLLDEAGTPLPLPAPAAGSGANARRTT